jgi:hypothetical protein
MPLEKSRGNGRTDFPEVRTASATAESYALREQLVVHTRRWAELVAEARSKFEALRLAHMQHTKHMAEIKLSCFEGSEVCSVLAVPSATSRARPYGVPIQ